MKEEKAPILSYYYLGAAATYCKEYNKLFFVSSCNEERRIFKG